MPVTEEKAPRILIGGSPYGQNQVDHEGSLECAVNIIREVRSDAEIWVCTNTQKATEKKLGVQTLPFLGTDSIGRDQTNLQEVMSHADAFIWAGGTGLSDYPNVALEMLGLANDQKKFTAIFCVGMNDRLNPASALPNDRGQHAVSNLVKLLTLGIVDLAQERQAKRNRSFSDRIQGVVPNTDLVILGDVSSQAALSKVLREDSATEIGADLLITLPCYDIDACRFPESTRRFLDRQGPLIGIAGTEGIEEHTADILLEGCNQIIDEHDANVIGIPFHPGRETPRLSKFRDRLEKPNSMHVIEGVYEPDEIAAIIGRLDVLVSEQLAPLVLASNSLTPFLNLGGESSVGAFTHPFERSAQTTTPPTDAAAFCREINELIQHRTTFRQTAKKVRCAMLSNLNQAKGLLREALAKL